MANRLYNQQVTPKGYKKGGAIEPEYSIKQEVKDIMRKETPKTFKLLKGLSPVTQMRKYMTKKKVKKARARDEAKVSKKEKHND
tara:strand:+ start:527 stop:778 length:252 start_codon:yes stop_codon:yes gene_type:complete